MGREPARGEGALRHEGYSGKTVEFLAANVPAHFRATPADIVLRVSNEAKAGRVLADVVEGAVDLVAERLRAFPIEVLVVCEPGGALSETDNLAPLTVAFMPAQTYPGGAVVIDHEYAESGRYAAFLTVSEPSGLRRTTRFAFVVGSAFSFFAPAMLGGVFLAGLVFAYWRHSGNRRGMRCAKACVFDHDGQCNLRVFSGCKRHVQRMVALVLFAATVNLLISSASAKWALLAPVFVPMFMLLGYSPELVQGAFRVGDSVTNIITPLMSYFPLILTFAQKYEPKAGIGTMIATMLPYSIWFTITWTALLIAWIALGIPMGPGAPLFLAK